MSALSVPLRERAAMRPPHRPSGGPQLLVSVRDPDEAERALRGGADIIDVKEPGRGPLGMADVSTLAAVMDRVGGRASVSAALGEVAEWVSPAHSGRVDEECAAAWSRKSGSVSKHVSGAIPSLPSGLSFLKLGLSGLAGRSDWIDAWLCARAAFERSAGCRICWVAAAYADPAAEAPPIQAVIDAAARTGCTGVLIDTFDKSQGGLFDYLRPAELQTFSNRARSRNLFLAVAGRLAAADVELASVLGPEIIGVRSAACISGDRRQSISTECVAALKHRLQTASALEAMIEAHGPPGMLQ